MPQGRAYITLATGTFCTAAVYAAGRDVMAHFSPDFVAAGRFLIAAAVLVPMLLITRRWRLPERRDIGSILALGVSGVILYNLFLFGGLRLSLVSHGTALMGASPVLTMVLAKFWRQQAVSRQQWLGALAALVGVGILTWPSEGWAVAGDGLLGDALFLCAALCWAFYAILSPGPVGRYGPLLVTTWGICLAAVLLLPVSLVSGGAGEAVRLDLSSVSAITFMATFGTVLAFLFWFRGVKEIGPIRASIFLNLIPVYGAALGWFFFDEPLSLPLLTALVLIIGGVRLVQKPPRQHCSGTPPLVDCRS